MAPYNPPRPHARNFYIHTAGGKINRTFSEPLADDLFRNEISHGLGFLTFLQITTALMKDK